MAKFSFSDISDAFLWVSSAMYGMNSAMLHKDTGKIFYHSEMGDIDEIIEDDDPIWEQFIYVPHKNDLDLGKELVFEFVNKHLPQKYDIVWNIFRSGGAYGRYKTLLDQNGLLQTWYDYENNRTEHEIRKWCQRNKIELEEKPEEG